MKKFVKLGFAMVLAMAFAFVGCKHEPASEVGGIYGSQVFIDGRNVPIRSNLWACDHEVTQAEYETYCTYGVFSPSGYHSRGRGSNYPAYFVTWYDCLVYCNKRSIAEGLTPCYTVKGSVDPSAWGAVPASIEHDSDWDAAICNFEANGYRLPTEAEWEYLARGGNMTNSGQTKYSGSNTIGDVAWYNDNSSALGSSNPNYGTHEVKTKAPNTKGLYDMTGNVWEWCWDWSGIITIDTPYDGVPSGPARVVRGGSWFDLADCCAISFRHCIHPFGSFDHCGFRVVRSTQE